MKDEPYRGLGLCSFAVVIFNLFRMQIIKGSYYVPFPERNRVRVIYLEGARGKVMDEERRGDRDKPFKL